MWQLNVRNAVKAVNAVKKNNSPHFTAFLTKTHREIHRISYKNSPRNSPHFLQKFTAKPRPGYIIFFSGATCSSMDLCCEPTTCGLKASGVVCRDAVNTCDIEEQCDGVNSECPTDSYHSTGDNCTVDGVDGHCYFGNCRSHYAQCLELA